MLFKTQGIVGKSRVMSLHQHVWTPFGTITVNAGMDTTTPLAMLVQVIKVLFIIIVN